MDSTSADEDVRDEASLSESKTEEEKSCTDEDLDDRDLIDDCTYENPPIFAVQGYRPLDYSISDF